jgi:outer membrane protein OmpA-like peptidoglycan-associated protein
MSKSGNVYYFLDDVKLNPLEPDAPCDDAGKNIEMAYAQNYRHSEYIAVKPVEVLKPTFINDTIRIPAAYFDVGKSSVKENRMAFIDSLALSFSGRPIAQISIYGYTDATGDSTLNVVLSEQRAASIRNRIISVVPEFARVIRSEGLGALQPRASNNTIAGRALNRRVEIVLTYQIK